MSSAPSGKLSISSRVPLRRFTPREKLDAAERRSFELHLRAEFPSIVKRTIQEETERFQRESQRGLRTVMLEREVQRLRAVVQELEQQQTEQASCYSPFAYTHTHTLTHFESADALGYPSESVAFSHSLSAETPSPSLVEQARRFAETPQFTASPILAPIVSPAPPSVSVPQSVSVYQSQSVPQSQSSCNRSVAVERKPSMQSPRARKYSRSLCDNNDNNNSNNDDDSSAILDTTAVVAGSDSVATNENETNNTGKEEYAPVVNDNSGNLGDDKDDNNNNGAVQIVDPPVGEGESAKPIETETNRLSEDLHSMVRQAVQDEMLADAQAQHYTKRLQNKLIATKQNTLVDRIEKSVADKIQQLQKELEELKQMRVEKKKPQSSRMIGRKDEEREAFLSELLKGLHFDSNEEENALAAEINQAVEFAILRFLSLHCNNNNDPTPSTSGREVAPLGSHKGIPANNHRPL